MKTTFNISTDNFEYSTAQLFIEIAPRQLSAFVLDGNNCFNNLLSYTFSSNFDHFVDEIREIIKKPLFNNVYKKTSIIWILPESILTPASLFKESHKNEMLSLVFGPGESHAYLTDSMPKSNMHNVYRVDHAFNNLLCDKYPGMQQYHQFSILPEINQKDGMSLLCIFYNSGVSIQVQKNGKIIFANYFNYTAPQDVSYYLLSICTNFDINVEEINVILAGLIEKESILYRELYNYFLHISFLNFSDKYLCNEEFKGYPQHFFSHLFATAICV